MLNLSIIPPRFTISPNNVVSLDNGKKGQGRLMLEWVPRNAEGMYVCLYVSCVSRATMELLFASLHFTTLLTFSFSVTGTFVVENIVRFALGPDEVGLTVDQLPDNEVEFSRITMMGNEVSSTDVMPDKVVRMTPLEGGGVSFKLDFEMNGVGGQTFEKDGAGHITGPFEVVGQRGEVIVMRELMRTSIPALSGWSTMFNIAIENAVNSISGGGGAGGGGGQHGVPF